MRRSRRRRTGNQSSAPDAAPPRQDGRADHSEYSVAPFGPPGTWVPTPLTSEAYEPPPRASEPYEPYPPRQAAVPRYSAVAGVEARSEISRPPAAPIASGESPADYGVVPEPTPVSAPAATAEQVSDAGRWDSIVVDRPTFDLEPKPSLTGFYRPDTEFDGWSTLEATMRMASVRGYRHRYYGRPRQDHAETAVHAGSGTVVFAVADGVSSAEQSELGALIACHTAVDTVLDQLDRSGRENQPVEWEQVLARAAARLVERAAAVLNDPAPDAVRVENLFATTLVAGRARPVDGGLDVHLARVGDSGAWILQPDLPDNRYTPVFSPKTAPDDALVSNAVSPLPRVPEQIEQRRFRLRPGAVLLVGTDGFGDPLGDGDGRVGELFTRHLSTPPSARQLAHVLDFSRETFDDDRTLFALWPRRGERP